MSIFMSNPVAKLSRPILSENLSEEECVRQNALHDQKLSSIKTLLSCPRSTIPLIHLRSKMDEAGEDYNVHEYATTLLDRDAPELKKLAQILPCLFGFYKVNNVYQRISILKNLLPLDDKQRHFVTKWTLKLLPCELRDLRSEHCAALIVALSKLVKEEKKKELCAEIKKQIKTSGSDEAEKVMKIIFAKTYQKEFDNALAHKTLFEIFSSYSDG